MSTSPKKETHAPEPLDDDLFVQAAAERIRSRLSRTAQEVIEIGRDLVLVKERLGHGRFLPWIEREFGMSIKTAERLMAVAEKYGGRGFDIVTKISPTALYELAAPSTPEEVRIEIEQRAAAGQAVTAAEIKALKLEIKERKQELKTLQAKQIPAETDNRSPQPQLLGLREELRRLADKDSVDTYRAALTSVWQITPPEVRSWFLCVLKEQQPTEIVENENSGKEKC